jgi:peptidoglycan/xylan/chitin deacetylase (PgdA/CDA1 family)
MEPTPERKPSHWPRRALFAASLGAPCLSLLLLSTNVWIALAPMIACHLCLLYAILAPNCQWLGPVACFFSTEDREVWLTIDDGPSPHHTIAILDLLDRFDARATFFVIGRNAAKYPHLITEILARGHSVANHTYTHPTRSFWAAGPVRTSREIARCAEHLRAGPDRPPLFFRAPAGIKNLFLHPELERRKLVLIGWSIRGLDTVRRDSGQIATKIVERAIPGAIIVLHEDHRTESDPEFNPRCVEATLTGLTEKGFRCVIPQPEQLQQRPPGK